MQQDKQNPDGKITWLVFVIFFKIGIGTIGGGYAMIPMMERELVERRGWINRESFLDVIAIAQTSPGIFAVNMASHIGLKLGGLRLAVVATVANILPPFLIILTLALTLGYIRDIVWIEHAFKGVRPVVVALIAAPVFTMARSAGLRGWLWLVPIIVASAIYYLGISPVYLIFFAISGGIIYSLWHSK
ncbi:MAG: chromate transporter [Porphyromonadaceae bacterium]|nr:chromate transporter [Porphyromonadaceae bacterium]